MPVFNFANILLTNNHPPDITIAKPVFHAGRIAFWSVSKGHHADVGEQPADLELVGADALQKGDEVVTAGGVLGRVTKVTEAYAIVEIASGVEISVQKGAVQTLLPKGTLKSLQ